MKLAGGFYFKILSLTFQMVRGNINRAREPGNRSALVAQLDRVPACGAEGCVFESRRGHQEINGAECSVFLYSALGEKTEDRRSA